ncbi:MAG: electron transport complex subunit RsxC [Candidatus Competibacteraceae bacterium]|jgi:electron transport complex protein RnfC|nr:electron transport complex subunit RsxC [Candidatus Competibacteraceae bacterium]
MSLARSFSQWRFNGGLLLDTHLAESTQQPVLHSTLPEWLILPLQQHIGTAPKIDVEIGQTVRKGQLLAHADGYISAALHAPSSGVITALEERPIAHPSGLSALCLILHTDGRDEWDALPPPIADYKTADPLTLRQRIRQAGIVGLGGAAFPTSVKLNPVPTTPIQLLILNGAECEPYITCDDMLMCERAHDLIGGVLIMRYMLSVEEVIIGVEDNKPEACAALEAALEKFGAEAGGIAVRQVPTIYPTGGEKQLIRVLTGQEVPSNGLPADIGVICQNVGTAVAVYEAVTQGRPLISRYITVTGSGIQQPRVMEALIGTPISELVHQCGGYTEAAQRLIVGGPMMGFAVPSDEVPIVKGANCILVATTAELAPPVPAMPCIRCGACADVCPADLLPQQLYWHAKTKDFDKVADYHLFDCIECGCCAAVCPSHIPLVQYYRFAKTEIWARERERQQADLARQRHEFRLERLERDKREKETKLRKRKEALQQKSAEKTDDTKKEVIEAAVKRAKAKKASQKTADPVAPVSDPVGIAESLDSVSQDRDA